MAEQTPAFSELDEFCSVNAGGRVLFATDDFFAVCENMLSDSDPIFITDKYTEFGKWMDGWETRRKRIPGHDWCIIKLATKCVIRGVLLDTAFFTGNYTPKYSIQAACLTPQEEGLIPVRKSVMGSCCEEDDLKQMEMLKTDQWEEIIPITSLRPGYQNTKKNYQKAVNNTPWTHIRLNIFPDGGVARLRVYGEARPEWPPADQLVDLVNMFNGGVCQVFSNAHFGHPRNVIKPKKGVSMADGWETARRLDRPEVCEANADGTLKVPPQCEEWSVFKLGTLGTIVKIGIDTAHFKGNFPDWVKIEGALLKSTHWEHGHNVPWRTILNPSKLSANSEHWFECESEPVSHVRVTIAPDGGFSRLRVFGYRTISQ